MPPDNSCLSKKPFSHLWFPFLPPPILPILPFKSYLNTSSFDRVRGSSTSCNSLPTGFLLPRFCPLPFILNTVLIYRSDEVTHHFLPDETELPNLAHKAIHYLIPTPSQLTPQPFQTASCTLYGHSHTSSGNSLPFLFQLMKSHSP